MNDVLINHCNIIFLTNKMAMSFLFIAIITFRQAEGRYVGGFGPLRAGNQRVKIRVKKTHGQISTICTL